MENVVLISTSSVRPKNIKKSNPDKIHLNPFDFSFFGMPYPKFGIILPKPDSQINIISKLKTSLSLTLEIFYPLVGRIVSVKNEDETTSFYIDCDGSNGVKFVHAMAENVAVCDIVESKDGFVPDLMKHFFLAHGLSCYQGISNPLLAVQATELKDGVFLSWAMNHLVADGFSKWDFIHTWSKICSNGLTSIARGSFTPIRLREWFLDNINYPIHIPNSMTNLFSGRKISPSPLLREKKFHFTKQQILKLKAKAYEEIGTSIDVKISSFQVVSGFLWRSIIRQSCINSERDVHFKFAMGLRQRIDPNLDGKECFGNMATVGTATTTAGELLEQGIGRAALRIYESVGLYTKENIRIFAESLVKNTNIVGVAKENICDTLVVGGSSRFNVYDNNFGWGKPVAVRAGAGAIASGLIFIFPGIEEGSMDIQTCLPYDVFMKLFDDNEFMENVIVV